MTIEESKYPKILIVGQPFNNNSGGGITLTNLFKGWPKNKIAVTATGHVMYYVTTEICNIYYQLGKDEQRWIFPFSLIQKPFPSGLKSFGNEAKKTLSLNKKGIRYLLVNQFFFPMLKWTGIFHFSSKIILSKSFKDWLIVYQPELLYFQIASREDILFATELRDFLNIPSAIHMMDDWPSTISSRGLFKKFWKSKIDKEFRHLLDKIDIHLGISDYMSEEYSKRYQKCFKAFHNLIDTSKWLPYFKTNFKLNNDHVKVLYSGRIGIGITKSLIEVADAIDTINQTWGEIKLYIQSPSEDNKVKSELQKHECIVINPVVEYSQLPKIFSCADILIIANDFDKQGIDFLKFSMPTKVSEYMISSTPVLVYASSETAVSKFFTENECGCCVTEQEPGKLDNAFKLLINDEEYRKKLSYNAVKTAKDLFDGEKVRKEFQQLLISNSKKGSCK